MADAGKWKAALGFLMLISVGVVSAQSVQSVRFRHISNQDGLSQNTVTALAQDQSGFIWMGTQDGLNRYDGYKFQIFKHDQSDSTSLASNWVLSLCIDHKNRIWTGSSGGGLQVLEAGSGQFQSVILGKNGNETPTSIYSIAQDSENVIWATSSSGLIYRIEEVESKFQIRSQPAPGRNVILTLKPFRKTQFLASSRGSGPLILDTKTFTISKLSDVLELSEMAPFEGVLDMFALDSTRVVVGTDVEGAWIVSQKAGFQKIVLPEDAGRRAPPIRNVNADKNGNVWLGSDGFGAFRLNPKTGEIDVFGAFFTDDYSLSDNSIYSSLLDRQGVFWIGTFLGGVNTVDPFNNRFLTLGVSNNPKRTLSNPMVRALQLLPDGKLWIGTRGGGVHVYTPVVRTVERPFPEGMMDQRTNALLLDSKDRMWVGTWGGGLYVVSGGKIIKHFQANESVPNALPDNRIRVLFEDSKKRIWVGAGQIGQGVLSIYNEKNDEFSVVKLNRKGVEDPAVNNINHIYEDGLGRFWLSTFGGLLRLSGGSGAHHATGFQIEYFRKESDVPGTLGHNIVHSLTKLENGDLWLSSYGLGIAKIEESVPGKLTFHHVTEKDGLPSNGVFGILEDRKGNLWLGTNKGITKYNPSTKALRQFYKSDGITSNQINQGAYFKSSGGILFFGTAGGLTLFDPAQLTESTFEPNVVFTDLQVFGESYLHPLELSHKKRIELTSEQNFLTFEFAALDFSSPASILYQCYLEGFDKNWIQLGNRRIVNYTNLNPGLYTMKVRSTNSDGVWSSKTATMEIYIVPPFYRTKLFYASSFIIITFLIFALLRYRESVLNKRNEELEQAVAERTAQLEQKTRELELKSFEAETANKAKSAFLAGMSHELRTPLNAILGFSQILFRAQDLSTRYREFAETMYRSGNHLLAMINDVLDISKIEAGRMELKPVDFDLSAMLRDLEAMFKLDCRQKSLSLSLTIDSRVPRYVFADNSKVRQILINLIGNAVKYTSSGGISIHAGTDMRSQTEPDFQSGTLTETNATPVWFTISDTGEGIEPQRIAEVFEPFRQQEEHVESGTGLGLAITSELVKLMGGMVTVSSRPGKGSVFSVCIPFELSNKEDVSQPADAIVYTGIKGDKKWTVLIVDDIASNIELLHVMLEKIGFRCIMANDGKTGLDLFDKEKPDLVLLDLRMPGMRGEEVLRRIRRKENGQKTPVIAITASVFEGNELTLIDEGFSGFIIKPFHQNELFAMMAKLGGIDFETELAGAFSSGEKEDRSVDAMCNWVLTLPDELRFTLSDAIISSDLKAIATICEPLAAEWAEAGRLLKESESGNYRFILAMADRLDAQV